MARFWFRFPNSDSEGSGSDFVGVARLQNEVGAKDFSELGVLNEKWCEVCPNFGGFILWVRKIRHIPSRKSRKIHRRASAESAGTRFWFLKNSSVPVRFLRHLAYFFEFRAENKPIKNCSVNVPGGLSRVF